MLRFRKKDASQTPAEPDAARADADEAVSAPTDDPARDAPSPQRPKRTWFGRRIRPTPDAAPAVAEPAPSSADAPAADTPAPRHQTPPVAQAAPSADPLPDTPDDQDEERAGRLRRLRERLGRTRRQLGDGMGNLLLGHKRIDDDLFEDLETRLLTADVGVETTQRIIADLTARVKRRTLSDPEALLHALRDELRRILIAANAPVAQPDDGRPQVILMVGVNGAGKTTTIGKLAKRLQQEGNTVMLAAGDTFRAAAVEQLQAWGERNAIAVIAQHNGADSASVIFDALQAATAREADVLIADTAGRLHTKGNLMEELAKVARVMKKLDPNAPHEVMLVVDATTGQNALNQAEHFHRAIGLNGVTLTKLDGTAKGGIVFAIAERLGLPIRFIGVGESIDDLHPFDADDYVEALLG